MTAIHFSAQQGFTVEAQTYAKGRPEYPDELLPWLLGAMHLGPGKHVVDLGAGTGKFTKLLVASGATVTAVEPVDAMRAQLVQRLPNVSALVGSADAIPLQATSVDAVVCAQSFHWFATKAALTEIHRVLKSGGKLGLIWNVRDESFDWVAAITAIITPYEGDAPRFYKGDWRKPFAAPAGPGFSGLEQTNFAYQHLGSAQEVIIDRRSALLQRFRRTIKQPFSPNSAIWSHRILRCEIRKEFPSRTGQRHTLARVLTKRNSFLVKAIFHRG